MKCRLLFPLLLLNLFAVAQHKPWCNTDQLMQHELESNPATAAKVEEGWNQIRAFIQSEENNRSANTIITIPVVFHVIHSGQAVGTGINISDAQIQSQMAVLNECFRKKNADTSLIPNWFKGRDADLGIEFCLATSDPQGNPTTGITRDYYPNLANFDVNVKPTTQWDPNRYLNIWSTILQSPLLGYATPPFFGPLNQDGVVLDYRQIGKNPANPFGSGKLGRTCVHEVGHWLGLYHTFQDSCAGTTPQTCAFMGDRVCDTPPSKEATYGSSPNLVQNTCTESPVDEYDMWMNYMDYVNDNWLIMFTNGQREIVRAVLNTSRLSIQSSLGCTNTASTFSYTGKVVDASTNQGVAGAKVLFDGAQDFEATTDANGNFTINNMYEGYYDVYAGKWGWRTNFFMSHEYFISVSPTVTIPIKGHQYYDDFIFNYNWNATGTAGGGFWTRDIPIGTFYQSNAANPAQDIYDDYGLKCFVTGNAGGAADADDVDNGTVTLFSPSFDLSNYTDPYLRYYRWFASLAIGGNTPDDFMTVKLNNGITTVTVETITTTENEWKQKLFRISDLITPTSDMRLIVEVSDLANGNSNIVEGALDKFEVLESTSVSAEELSLFENVRVYPNPTKGMLNVALTNQATPTQVEVLNTLGQVVHASNKTQAVFSIDVSGNPTGLYLLRLRAGSSEKVVKFSLTR
ncbi:MAG: T9SS type A sorting domain-containing protein [Chitinophagales bacterium]|nr:T9SS type A sorting domain-containing protein [Chitinophagales bacterium]